MINVQSLDFSYGKNRIFSDLSLPLAHQRFTALLGPNGSGKTTLLKLILGLLVPGGGCITFQGRSLDGLTPRERASLMAYVPQAFENTYDFTVEETVLMGRYPHIRGWHRESRQDRMIVKRALDRLEIAHLASRSVNTLSGGEKQRALIARAFAQETPLILLDEPTAFLDLKHQLGIMEIIGDIGREKNKRVIAVIHDLNLALNYADYAVLLKEGRVISRGVSERIITPRLIREVYDVTAAVVPHDNGKSVIPRFRASRREVRPTP